MVSLSLPENHPTLNGLLQRGPISAGKLILVNRKVIIDAGENEARKLLRTYAARVALMTITPASSWLETFIHTSAKSVNVTLLNHGHLSEGIAGNANGAYAGKIHLKTSVLKGAVNPAGMKIEYLYPIENRGQPIPFTINGDLITMDVKADQFAELILK